MGRFVVSTVGRGPGFAGFACSPHVYVGFLQVSNAQALFAMLNANLNTQKVS